MRYAGIDVGSQTHVVAIVGPEGDVLVKPSAFAENAAGYEKLLGLLGSPSELVVIRQLHRLVDLGFPEFDTLVRTLDSRLATTILHEYPTAAAFDQSCLRKLARLRYDTRHRVGLARARQLIETAGSSVGQHHSPAFQQRVRYLAHELDQLRATIDTLTDEVEAAVRDLPLAELLTSVPGIGTLTAARIIASVENPARFQSAAAFAAYVGVVPATRLSGLHRPTSARISAIGNARLRKALWMPALSAVKANPWLRDHYQQLRARGKHPKVALTAVMQKLVTAIYSVAKHQKPFTAREPPPSKPPTRSST